MYYYIEMSSLVIEIYLEIWFNKSLGVLFAYDDFVK